MKKRNLLIAALLSGILTASACAVDFGYSGPLDEESGEPSQSAYSSVTTSDSVSVSSGVSYVWDRLGYVYTVGNSSAQIMCTAVDGMVLQQGTEVRVEPDAGVEVTLYQGGTALEDPDLTHIYDVGDYVVEANIDGQIYQVLTFSIVGETTCKLTGYTMPDGFAVTGATLDGDEISYQRSYVSMAEEGAYVIEYTCVATGVTYELDVTVDTTPPVLALAELDDKNQARGPVSIADMEEGASIGITLDGQQISYRSELTESGEYQIVLMDAAGNVTQYAFTILVYFDMNSLLFIGIVLLAAIAVGAYIFISRKKLAVR